MRNESSKISYDHLLALIEILQYCLTDLSIPLLGTVEYYRLWFVAFRRYNMHSNRLTWVLSLSSILGVVAAVPTNGQLDPRQTVSCNTPEDRACWSDGFDINTDYELETPEGITRTFDLEITEIDNWTGPDGIVKEKVMLINGQYPGPVLYADWGDTLVINVVNSMVTNG